MKQRTKASIFFAAAALLVAGCQKEESFDREGSLKLNLEAFGSGSKTTIGADDLSLQWVAGDQVRINGADYTVALDGSGNAYASDVAQAALYRAVFPASVAEGQSLSSSTATVTLPRQYEYSTSGVLQVLDAPLAAVGDGNDGLMFYHLTGALTVVIKNTTSQTLYIDTVYVSSAQQLCGDITVDFDNLTAVSPNTSPSNPEDTMVLLTVPYNTLSVAAGAEVKVQIPVLPVSADNRFTIHVASRYQGTRYDFHRRQSSASNALSRNQLGYAPASIATSGTYISVLPLFEYDEDIVNVYNELVVYIKSPLDFLLLSEATNNDWPAPVGSELTYRDIRTVYFYGTIDMEGYTIQPLHLKGYGGMLDVEGQNNCQISNLTINGSHLLVNNFIESWFWIQSITFNNLTINVPSDASLTAPLLELFDSKDVGVKGVHVNGLTFNIPNSDANRSLSMAGIMNECDIYRDDDDLDWFANMSYCSVTDISINVTGVPLKDIEFGGLANSLFNSVMDGDAPRELINIGSYTQNNPLNLTATGHIYYGGVLTRAFDMFQDNNVYMGYQGSIIHNAVLNAPVVVAGGIMGYYDNECQEGDVYWNNANRVVTQSGTIDIMASTYRSGKKIATAVAPCNIVDFTDPNLEEYDIIVSGASNINDDALTINMQ